MVNILLLNYLLRKERYKFVKPNNQFETFLRDIEIFQT